jgi:hypothetical protein
VILVVAGLQRRDYQGSLEGTKSVMPMWMICRRLAIPGKSEFEIVSECYLDYKIEGIGAEKNPSSSKGGNFFQ